MALSQITIRVDGENRLFQQNRPIAALRGRTETVLNFIFHSNAKAGYGFGWHLWLIVVRRLLGDTISALDSTAGLLLILSITPNLEE